MLTRRRQGHPPDCFLNGLTRQTIIALARQRGIKVVERAIVPNELAKADEVFLTGSAAEVTPVGEIIGEGGHYRFTPGHDLPPVVGRLRPAGRQKGRGDRSVTCSLPKPASLRFSKRSPDEHGLRFCDGKMGRNFGEMSEGPILDVPKLSEQEMQQLQVLLFRYLTHKPAGFSNIVTEKLVKMCQATLVLEAPGVEPPIPPVGSAKRKSKPAPAPAA